jgi:hypothetical protein
VAIIVVAVYVSTRGPIAIGDSEPDNETVEAPTA